MKVKSPKLVKFLLTLTNGSWKSRKETDYESKKIGKFLAGCRKQKNLTQEQLSEILGVSSKSVSRWENGITLPDYTVLDSLCKALGISVNEFYYGEKKTDMDFEQLSEQNLRLYFREKYGKRLRLKFAVLSGIIGMLIFIIIQLVFLR